MPTALNLRIADRLLEDGLITQGDHRQAVEYARSRAVRIEEALIILEVIEEVELLRYLAKLHRTQFVSTERLSRAQVDTTAVRMVPRRLVAQREVFPLLFDRKSQRLVVATADPDNLAALDDLRAATPAREVRALVARPAAIAAAVARAYDGDRYAFTNLLRSSAVSYGELDLRDPFQREAARRISDKPQRAVRHERPSADARIEAQPSAAHQPSFPHRVARGHVTPWRQERIDEQRQQDRGPRPHREQKPERRPPRPPPPRVRDAEPPAAPRRARRDPLLRAEADARVREKEPLAAESMLAPDSEPPAEPIEALAPIDLAPPTPPVKRSPQPDSEPPDSVRRSLRPPPSRLNLGPVSRRTDRPAPLSTRPTGAQLIEMLRVLVGLIENERPELRGHSSTVARLVQDACERIGLSEAHTGSLVVAAYLHDLGKRSRMPSSRRGAEEVEAASVHLTALNVAHFQSYRELAKKLVALPEQLMESVGLPDQTLTALRTMYEQVDGNGVPAGLAGNDMPIGGRILAVADTYADLTHNPRNTYDKLLSPEKAMEVLRENATTVFDPNIVEVFGHATTGEQILTQLLDERHRVLIIDPDPEQTLVLQLRLTDQGFEVHVARNTSEARSALAARKFALVVSEIDLEENDAGLFLREEVAKSDGARDISWVFLSGRSSRGTAKRAFDLGVDDFIAKPASVEIVVAKLIQLVEREERQKPAAARGVSGSLSDMAMTDIVQILFHGQRTCALHIEWPPDQKGELHFLKGRIVQAILGEMHGENAFYRMLSLGEDGQFKVDPTFSPAGEPAIKASPEALLLEGMRLLDEGLVP